jgi:putative transposase
LRLCKTGLSCRRVGPPRMKGRGHDVGLRYPNPSQLEFDGERGRVKLPKVGWLRLRVSRPVEGEIRSVSITREGDRWFASVQTSVAEIAPSPDLAPTLGIDLGIANFAAFSQRVDGRELVAPLDALRRQAKRLARYQRSMARKTKGSNNRRKAVNCLASLHRRIARQRRDWLHQLSTRIAAEHSVVALEDLRVASLSKSARGNVDRPGRNVKAKSRLNRAILDQGWSEFRRQLEYKLAWRGGRLILVEAAYTSRTCRTCGFEDEGNRLWQDTFRCLACGHEEHAYPRCESDPVASDRAEYYSRGTRGCCLWRGS